MMGKLHALLIVFALSACTNGRMAGNTSKDSNSATAGANANVSTASTAQLVSVQFALTNSGYEATLSFDARKGKITESLDNSSQCSFRWNDLNRINQNVSIPRYVKTQILSAQDFLVKCRAPAEYEYIADGSKIAIALMKGSGQSAKEVIYPMEYTKLLVERTGNADYTDKDNRTYENVYRYACFDYFQKTSRIKNFSLSNNMLPVASRFDLSEADYTSQSYYYNLYVRQTERTGFISPYNNSYICPLIKKPLRGTEENYWPLDTSFALASSPDSIFSVAVDSPSILGTSDGQKHLSCFGKDTTYPKSARNSILKRCLGYAAKKDTAGKCPVLRAADNTSIQTYPLRRFTAIYPNRFEGDGSMKASNQFSPVTSDTIYVVDRPVATAIDQNATMLGPKPCPFSYFDKYKVAPISENLNTPAGYVGSNYDGWRGKNVDGLELPNYDYSGNGEKTCSAAIPLYNWDTNIMSIGTVHYANNVNYNNPIYNHVYIRPYEPFTPDYREDTQFDACAPLSFGKVQDPPIHIIKAENNAVMGYCAEVYPTQNPYVAMLEASDGTGTTGAISPFTSGVAKGIQGQSACVASPTTEGLPGGYPAAGYANHPNGKPAGYYGHENYARFPASVTCDRTIKYEGGADVQYVPLQAPPFHIEKNIRPLLSGNQSANSYGCVITTDSTGAKTWKQTPSGGCCNYTYLSETANGSTVASPTGNAAISAHIEPKDYSNADHLLTCPVPGY